MICDEKTCCSDYLDSFDENYCNGDSFLQNLQHEKCKVIRLIRKQIHKLENSEYELPTEIDDERHNFKFTFQDTSRENQEITPPKEISVSVNVDREGEKEAESRVTFLKRVLKKFPRRSFLILIALTIGIVVWALLMYSVLVGVSLCNNGRLCVMPFRYSQAKHVLF